MKWGEAIFSRNRNTRIGLWLQQTVFMYELISTSIHQSMLIEMCEWMNLLRCTNFQKMQGMHVISRMPCPGCQRSMKHVVSFPKNNSFMNKDSIHSWDKYSKRAIWRFAVSGHFQKDAFCLEIWLFIPFEYISLLNKKWSELLKIECGSRWSPALESNRWSHERTQFT
jgi:hypothetical protein